VPQGQRQTFDERAKTVFILKLALDVGGRPVQEELLNRFKRRRDDEDDSDESATDTDAFQPRF